ncbi:MAG: potassium-transporting ATPase subunit F [Alkalinema sp. CACIAM 70d]|nr:MAG: potassium-transporting ATPase subunit F [Alkalinema sp. CACIAM 70d]
MLKLEFLETILIRFRQQRWPKVFLFALLGTLLLAPAVQAATGGTLDRGQTFALVLLGITTVLLSIYLFVVIFQPERF